MSTILVQQELINLLIASKKAFSYGRDMCDQANEYQKSSEKYIETLGKIHPKLLFVDTHVAVQLQAMNKMKDYLQLKTENCKNDIKNHETRLETLTIELTQIFSILKERKVDEAILQVNGEQGKEQSLFDYISDQEIIELQRQADDEIGEIENIHSALKNQTKQLETIIQEIQNQRKRTTIPLQESISAFTNEKIQLHGEETQKMADILNSLMKHFDQVQEATRISQLGPEQCDQLDITVLKYDDDQLPNITEELKIGLDVVISINEEIHQYLQIYLKTRDELIKLLNQLEQFGVGGQADMMMDKLMDSEAQINERQDALEGYFTQLSQLVEWYRCYSSSYNYLILEIDRRKRAQEKQEALKRELLASFTNAYNDELQERRSWSAQHGQYLPQVLCPFINDPPSILKVDIENSVATRLPELSPLSVDKALSEIHNQQ